MYDIIIMHVLHYIALHDCLNYWDNLYLIELGQFFAVSQLNLAEKLIKKENKLDEERSMEWNRQRIRL